MIVVLNNFVKQICKTLKSYIHNDGLPHEYAIRPVSRPLLLIIMY